MVGGEFDDVAEGVAGGIEGAQRDEIAGVAGDDVVLAAGVRGDLAGDQVSGQQGYLGAGEVQDGLKIAASVRRLSKQVPILFVSSLPNPAFLQEAKWLEPCSFVEKTQDPVDIIRGIRQTLVRFQVYQSLHPTSTYIQKP